MNMKRLFCTALALCLLMGSALAEGIRVLGDDFALWQAYQAAYPDREVEAIHASYDDNGKSNLQELLTQDSARWDVAFVWTDQCDLDVLDKAGLLMDLQEEDFAAQTVGEMYPAIRQAVTREGRLLGVPVQLFGMVMGTHMGPIAYNVRTKEVVDIAERLGFTAADFPKTFDDLCDLAQRYMALPKEDRKGTVFHVDAAASNAKNYFLHYLIEIYTAEFCDASGHVEYETPEFRQALESLEALAGALKGQGKITYGQGPQVYGLVSDGGSSLISHVPSFPLRIGNSTDIPARMSVIVVNAKTSRKPEAIDFAAYAAHGKDSNHATLFWEGAEYGQLATAFYDEMIQDQQLKLDWYQNEEEKGYGVAQETLAGMIQDRDSGNYAFFYPREAVEHYAQKVAPYLTFPRVPHLDAYAIAKEYVRGKLDADGLIAKLNQIADENMILDGVQR